MVEVAEVDPTLTLREETGPAPTGRVEYFMLLFIIYSRRDSLALFMK